MVHGRLESNVLTGFPMLLSIVASVADPTCTSGIQGSCAELKHFTKSFLKYEK